MATASPKKPSHEDRQLHRERVAAGVLLVILAAMMTLIVLLSVLVGGSEGVPYDPYMML